MSYQNFELKTQRLILKAISFEYLEDIFENFTPEITTFMYPKFPDKIKETAKFISDSLNEMQSLTTLELVILNQKKEEFLGGCGLYHLGEKKIEPGIWLKKTAHRNGYGKEAITALKHWADENLNYKYFDYPVDKENLASRKIPESLGGKIVREYQEKNQSGKILNLVEYRVYHSKLKKIPPSPLERGCVKPPVEESLCFPNLNSNILPTPTQIESNIVRCPDPKTAEKMISLIEKTRSEKDSLGGVVRCQVRNVPVGLGEPEFGKVPALLAGAMLSINATKGFEIGSGFAAASMRGSEHNDIFIKDKDGKIVTQTNHAGGTLGGITNGQIVDFKVAFKPVATIGKTQATVDKDGQKTEVVGKGRHDPCVVPRAVPIVEAMAALVMMDLYLQNRARKD